MSLDIEEGVGNKVVYQERREVNLPVGLGDEGVVSMEEDSSVHSLPVELPVDTNDDALFKRLFYSICMKYKHQAGQVFSIEALYADSQQQQVRAVAYETFIREALAI